MNPLLAKDWDPTKTIFPIGIQPKIDGVRGLTTEGCLTGRSLKKHKNTYTTVFYSGPEYANLDGELAAEGETHPDLCRITSSALSTIAGTPFTIWHLFDCLHKYVRNAEYWDRYKYLTTYIASEQAAGRCLYARVVPMHIVHNMEQLLHYDDHFLACGYEGTILRNLNAFHKEGRSTVNKAELLRIKRFITAEATVTGLEEGNANNNEAQTNELGRTFRSSHIDNKVPNGTVGNFQCEVFADVEYMGKTVLRKGQPITVAPGTMPHPMRKHLWEHPDEIVQKIITFKFFPKGIKDLPRFPTYQSVRSPEDMS